jgi:CPA2 family monovalent cation:H+ antiporter-2
LQGAITVAIAVASVLVILLIAVRFGNRISRIFNPERTETLVIGVLGLAMLVAGLAAAVQVSSAVGAFLVGIAISGQVAHVAQKYLTPLRDLFAAIFFVFFGLTTDAREIPAAFIPALVLALVTMSTKVLTGYLAARKAGIGRAGRWRAGFVLVPRGEFSIIIAAMAVMSGADSFIASVAATYVLITVISGPVLVRLADSPRIRGLLTKKASV